MRAMVLVAACFLPASGCAAGDSSSLLRSSESERVGWEGGGTDAPDPRRIAEGRRIAQSKCAACHSIDQSSVSPSAAAPPFREFVFLNDPDWVAYRLIDGMRLGHDNMPLFDLDVPSADALMAYIGTLND